MKLVLKMVSIVLLILVTLSFYYSRSQEIDFLKILPPEFRNCDKTIGVNSHKYVELKSWLSTNKTGWKNSPASHGSENQFISTSMTISVNDNIVVVNYKSDDGSWNQVVKNKALNDLSSKCM